MKNPWLFAKDFLLDNKGKGTKKRDSSFRIRYIQNDRAVWIMAGRCG